MKKFGIILLFVALVSSTGCSSMGGVNDAAAITSGAGCSQALLALNNSRNAGTLAITNPTDLSNILVVIGAYNGLKANKDNSNYKKSFTKGLVTGGGKLITSQAAANVTAALLNSAGFEGVNAQNISNKVQTVSTIISVLNALNQQ